MFLDANVLLEVLLGRNNEPQARSFLTAHSKQLFISSLTAHLIVHFGQAIVALPIIRRFLSDYSILELAAADFEWAFNNLRNNDYEDALQLAVAIRHGCSQFVTLDKTLALAYASLMPIEVILIN